MPNSLSRVAAFLAVCSVSALAACGGDDPAPTPSDSTQDAESSGKTSTNRDAGTDARIADARVGKPSEADASASDTGMKPGSNTPTDVSALKTDYQAFQARLAKLRACDILDDGVYTFDPRLDQRCESLCMIAASCDDLKTEACDQEAAASLEACFDACTEDVATCGDGKTVPAESVCDLAKDCSDGEDEAHCGFFTCKDESSVVGTSRCDGDPDCADESDEQGCALICGRPYSEIQ